MYFINKIARWLSPLRAMKAFAGKLLQLKPLLPRFSLSLTLLWLIWGMALLAIWLWGPLWTWGEIKPLGSAGNRIVATLLLLLLGLSAVSWYLYKQVQRALPGQQAAENLPYQASIDHQARFLDEWLQHYSQRSHLKNAMYSRPWYMMIGESISGKSTLIRKSDQVIPLNFQSELKREMSDGKALKSLGLFLTQSAVLIDPPGEFFQQDEHDKDKEHHRGRRLLQHLLDWLITHRPRQPLNGVVLTINIQELLAMTAENRRMWAQRWQTQILALSDRFACRVPVYIVINKIDVLNGFEAIYPALSQQMRNKTLGVSFSLEAEQGDSWRKELKVFWEEWQQNLNQLMPEQMINGTTIDLRTALFCFIGQLSALQAVTVETINDLLRHYNRDPGRQMLIRGLYFTSAIQQNRRSDFFQDAIAERYGLRTTTQGVWQPKDNQSGYFLHDLFSNTLFSEPNLAGENYEFTRLRRHQLTLATVIAGGVALSLLSGWYYYYLKNYRAGEVALKKVETFQKIGSPDASKPLGADWLPHMDIIRDATLSYGDYHEKNSLFSDMGLYQGDRIGQLVEKTYLRFLTQRFLPQLMADLQKQLEAAPDNSDEKLALLRIMRMLEDKSGRSIPLVEEYMRGRWQNAFTGQREVQERLMQHLDYALQHTDWAADRRKGDRDAIKAWEPFVGDVQSAQRELSKLPLYQRVYQNLGIKAREQLPPDLDLRTEIGAQFDTVFVADEEALLKIPQFWTRYGLGHYLTTQMDRLVDITRLDAWVLKLTEHTDYSEADKREIQRQITDRYVGDYVSRWRNALTNLSIRPFADISEATDALDAVLNNGQPIWRALLLLRDNTQTQLQAAIVDPDIPVAGAAKKEQKVAQVLNIAQKSTLEQMENQPDYILLNRIGRSFIEQKALVEHSDDQNGQLRQAYNALTAMNAELHRISNAPEPGKAALLLVQMRFQQNNADTFFTAKQMSRNLSDPLGRWVGQLADNSWETVMGLALQSLEKEWSGKVVTPFLSQLADKYPFNRRATKDVALSDMERFFAPDGVIDSFYKDNLKVFVEGRASAVDGKSVIRPEIVRSLQQADKIRSIFFSKQNGFSIQYAISPIELSANKRRAVLNLDGQLIDYTQGNPATAHLVWPNAMRSGNESKITLVPNAVGASPRSIGYSGPWATFHILDKGELTSIQDGSFDIRFTVDGGAVSYRVYMDASDNPFAGDIFSQFTLMDQLY
ncbi:type VI secretion system membrane subunit TssM [Enterobacter soli]|uniref:type VI secretion system membrane subunit TssM n=1 Tax=Enterobacter soli TaxID=885040 RepID=UPI003ED94F75